MVSQDIGERTNLGRGTETGKKVKVEAIQMCF